MFSVVKLAAEQLASEREFNFPEQDEPALIPLLKPIDSSLGMGVGQRVCEGN